ncbi:MAG: DEAD/DEAH box helicase [Nitriliruptoraceae bacterium]
MSDTIINSFLATLDFKPDAFQRQAISALSQGRSVLVAAPTGAGKTVVGEFACHVALSSGSRTFYTTPIKALSNQKYRDLVERYGTGKIGLLTGDRSINGSAPVVVMTTEVLRNMIYERSPALDELRYVVLDEVHYLADRSRGAVWEEVIIQLPRRVAIAALSATVSNAESFGAWLDQVRAGCTTIVEEVRPVPLKHHYFVNGRVHDTFRAGRKQGASPEHRERAAQAIGGVANPDVLMLERQAGQRNRVSNRGRRQAPSMRLRWPSRPEVVEELARRRWLPAILFVFSRAGCDAAAEQIVRSGVRLTSVEDREQIAVIVDTLMAELPPEDLRVLGYDAWRSMLMEGVAAHHAGMVPAFKECVEQLFQRGLLKVVVATETLALGINMPARTVVLERLEKWDGDRHVLLTPGEYTQLTGRAGRRGIDTVGHAVVLHQRDVDFRTVAGLVGTRTYPLASSFAPSYNMAVNLLRHHDLTTAERLLGSSFAQFEADASVARKVDRLSELEAARDGYAANLNCDQGDWPEYWGLRHALTSAEREQQRHRRSASSEEVRRAIGGLQPGDVIVVGANTRPRPVAVVGVHLSKGGTPIAQVVTAQASLTRVGPRELSSVPQIVDRMALPRSGNPRQRDFRRDVARVLDQIAAAHDLSEAAPPQEAKADTAPDDHLVDRIRQLRAEVTAHPCHHCDDRPTHEVWQHRWDDVVDELDGLHTSIARATGSLVRRFTRIRGILTDLGYLDAGDRPTDEGRRLARIYNEADLVVAEAIRQGAAADLDSGELAAWASMFVYEPRGGEPTPLLEYQPTDRLMSSASIVASVASKIRDREQSAGLSPLRDLDAGFVEVAWRWALGADLDDAVGDMDLTGGDFVRMIKQIADLLGQVRAIGDADLAGRVTATIDAIRRGIVEAG